MSSTWRSMWNGTRQAWLSLVPIVAVLVDAHDHAGDATAVAIIERDGVAALELARLGRRRDGLRRRLVRRLLGSALGVGVALHRHTRDLPASLGAFFQHRGLRVLHGDERAS